MQWYILHHTYHIRSGEGGEKCTSFGNIVKYPSHAYKNEWELDPQTNKSNENQI